MIKSPRTRSSPFERWPATDQAAWTTAVYSSSPFKPSGRGASWNATTQQSYRGSYGRWLHFLAESGQLGPALLPHTRVTEEMVRGFFRHLEGLADYTILTMIDSL